MDIRPAVFAGSWYPASAGDCERQIEEFLQQYETGALGKADCIAGLVPHAGWFYSGAVACNVVACLAKGPPVDVVAVFGMHLHPFSKGCIMTRGAWQTPFGPLEIDQNLAGELAARFDFTIETPTDFTQDNTIELQLPFVRYFFPRARIVPVGVPPASQAMDIGNSLVEIASGLGLKARIIGSTDLTHYGPNYGFTPQGTGRAALEWVRDQNDRRIIDTMKAMEPSKIIQQALKDQSACCPGAAAAAVQAAKALGACRTRVVAYCTSYDKSPSDSFVGYVGMVME